MDDKEIIELLMKRDENGIKMIEEKYSKKLRLLLSRFLCQDDVDEVLNDVLLAVWQSIPPVYPGNLYAYVKKISRNKALNFCKKNNTKKRSANLIELTKELEESIPGNMDVQEINLEDIFKIFLDSIKQNQKEIFIYRYWYGKSIGEIAQNVGCSESKVKSILYRTRKRLKQVLKKEGIEV